FFFISDPLEVVGFFTDQTSVTRGKKRGQSPFLYNQPPMDTAAERIVRRFGLQPHPEGGYFKEIYRSGLSVQHAPTPNGLESMRCAGTLIYFLLAEQQFSAFHRVRGADEIWHLYAGGPLELHVIDNE